MPLQYHYMKIHREEHYKTLVKQSRELELSMESSPKVEKESVDKALTEKIKLAQSLKEDLRRT